MTRLTRNIILILIVYVCYTQYLIRGYNTMNDSLQVSLDTLMRTCTSVPFSGEEHVPYK